MERGISGLDKKEFRRRELRSLVALRLWREFSRVAAEASALGFDFRLVDQSGRSIALLADMAGVADGDRPAKLAGVNLVVSCTLSY